MLYCVTWPTGLCRWYAGYSSLGSEFVKRDIIWVGLTQSLEPFKLKCGGQRLRQPGIGRARGDREGRHGKEWRWLPGAESSPQQSASKKTGVSVPQLPSANFPHNLLSWILSEFRKGMQPSLVLAWWDSAKWTQLCAWISDLQSRAIVKGLI